jgi:hypothetical protein
MAKAGTPHRNAFEPGADGALEGRPWIGEPQLWQNRASALSCVPQSLQNRDLDAEVFVGMVSRSRRLMGDLVRFECPVD